MVQEQLFYLGNKAVLQNGAGEVLLLKVIKKDGTQYWDLPGGRVNKGEDPKDAVVREVREETGITGVRVMKHIGMAQHTVAKIPISDDEMGGLILSVYICVADDTTVVQTEDGVEALWFAPDKVAECLSRYPVELQKAISAELQP